MNAQKNKRIPVSEKTKEKIDRLGNKGETYDELLNKMAECYEKQKLKQELKEQGVSKEAIKQIMKSEKDIEEGKTRSWSEVKEEL
ncbi:MAG: CopG family DNA-binding protein [Candidatus Methanohalarchaeum thermophilum]|uniref:CopG family DNA-binding protein n=1 Tax=Methanohalarchaeum thermophilum TaxID=1903181 RepID=A0A1Q6DS98_METT1|nr:MAG: CopG family DNA-binding protein [Candidatus Methanohalarchaeum thermophilum]